MGYGETEGCLLSRGLKCFLVLNLVFLESSTRARQYNDAPLKTVHVPGPVEDLPECQLAYVRIENNGAACMRGARGRGGRREGWG